MNTEPLYVPGKYSRDLFQRTIDCWLSGRDADGWAETLWNYYSRGLHPGSFVESVLANDMYCAMAHCHPSNNIQSIKMLCGWVRDYGLHGVASGDWSTVHKWTKLNQRTRLDHLVRHGLAYSSEQEVCLVLEDAPLTSL